MAYSWNKPLENLPEELTAIWSCGSNECKGWSRDNFSFNDQPVCPICKTAMIRSEKMLPILITTDQQIKNYRKKQRAEAISE